eukprot:gene13226-9072_t
MTSRLGEQEKNKTTVHKDKREFSVPFFQFTGEEAVRHFLTEMRTLHAQQSKLYKGDMMLSLNIIFVSPGCPAQEKIAGFYGGGGGGRARTRGRWYALPPLVRKCLLAPNQPGIIEPLQSTRKNNNSTKQKKNLNGAETRESMWRCATVEHVAVLGIRVRVLVGCLPMCELIVAARMSPVSYSLLCFMVSALRANLIFIFSLSLSFCSDVLLLLLLVASSLCFSGGQRPPLQATATELPPKEKKTTMRAAEHDSTIAGDEFYHTLWRN